MALTDSSRNAAANGIAISGNDVYVAGFELSSTYEYVAKYRKKWIACKPYGWIANGYSHGICD